MKRTQSILLLAFVLTTAIPGASAQTQIPATFVQRAELVMILLQNAGITVDKSAKTGNAYPDVIDGDWYVPYVVKGLELKMFEVEKSTGLLRPYASVSRADFLKMITKAFNLTTGIPYAFTDVPADAWYASYAGLAAKYGLFESAKKSGTLQPDLRVTHAEAIRAIVKLLAAEPQLQPKPGMVPVAENASETADPFQSAAATIQDTTRSVVEGYITLATPQSVKEAMLKLLQNRTNMAETAKLGLIDAVNTERAKYHLPPVRSNYYLEQAAQRHAQDMEKRGYFSHFTPEGLSYVDRIKNAEYLSSHSGECSCSSTFTIASTTALSPDSVMNGTQSCKCTPDFALGENLAKGQMTVAQVMEDWMNSPHHRENILRPEFEEIGIGLFGDVWVQDYGRLRFK